MINKQTESKISEQKKPAENESLDLRTNPWAYLVIAMLSLNKYPLENTWKIYDELEANGLFDPHNYASWSYKETFQRLISSHYDRGAMTGIFAERLLTIAILVDDVTTNEYILVNGTRQDILKLLARVKGIGPVVLDNFMLLRGK